MSHGRERKDKDCLNCGAIVIGRFCHQCGQENIEPHESFWSLLHHFFADITHFDGKFFSSVGVLICKPGYLSEAYISGQRNRYLNPIRMYVFASAVFFLVFFSIFNPKDLVIDRKKEGSETAISRNPVLANAYKNAHNREDSASVEKLVQALADSTGKKDSLLKKNGRVLPISTRFKPFDSSYHSESEYDSIQNALPPSKKDGWWRRMANRKSLEIGARYNRDKGEFLREVIEKFMHSFPYMLFVSLPLYAFFLKLLYIRRKSFYYADHGIFLVHLYIFTFIILILFIGAGKFEAATGAEWLDYFLGALVIFGFFYALKAMKNFYKQGWVKTIFKFLLFNLLCAFALMLIFAIFFGLSVIEI